MSVGLVLAMIFAVLKLTHHVAWNWNQVLLPVYIELGLGVLVAIIIGIIVVKKA